MIQSRPSNVYLSAENILKCISGLDIFKFYNPNIKGTTEAFCSDLRRDREPSCRIQVWGGSYLYKDFATGDVYNCFTYVQAKFGVGYAEALEIINNDFNLNLSNTLNPGDKLRLQSGFVSPIDAKKRRKVIVVEKRSWKNIDINLWSKWGISLKTLKYFEVDPISKFSVDGITTNCTTLSPAYVYKIFKGFKIYRPLEKDRTRKWRSNTRKEEIQGWEQLPSKGEILFLTSSLKDVMVLYEMGYNAIALQSEMEIPNEEMIKVLKGRFKILIVLYDNDYDKEVNWGQKAATQIRDKYGIFNICIPEEYESTDPSDLVYNIGMADAKQIIKSGIDNILARIQG
jgi:hypothetical protein